jgi:RIO kinase 1
MPRSDHAEFLHIESELETLRRENLITSVHRPLTSGKEANVYCCVAHPSVGTELLAVKIYRSRDMRSFTSDAAYTEGRVVTDDRLRRAIRDRTGTGRVLQATMWIEREYELLCTLYDTGADVPAPVAQVGSVLLMEYLGDSETSAPLLKQVPLDLDEAQRHFNRIMRNIELFLSCEIIHADLSPFNILYWDGEVKIIDFPQAVNAFDNPNARSFLERDVANICRHFARNGVTSDEWSLATDLWCRFLDHDLRREGMD